MASWLAAGDDDHDGGGDSVDQDDDELIFIIGGTWREAWPSWRESWPGWAAGRPQGERGKRQPGIITLLPIGIVTTMLMQGCEGRTAHPLWTAAQRACRPQRVQAAPRRGEGEGGGEGEGEKGEARESSRGRGEGEAGEGEARYCGLEEKQDRGGKLEQAPGDGNKD